MSHYDPSKAWTVPTLGQDRPLEIDIKSIWSRNWTVFKVWCAAQDVLPLSLEIRTLSNSYTRWTVASSKVEDVPLEITLYENAFQSVILGRDKELLGYIERLAVGSLSFKIYLQHSGEFQVSPQQSGILELTKSDGSLLFSIYPAWQDSKLRDHTKSIIRIPPKTMLSTDVAQLAAITFSIFSWPSRPFGQSFGGI